MPVLPEQIPTDPAELKELKKTMYNNDIVYGKYLSTDGKAALILAGFNEERLDYGNIQKQIMNIRKHVEDGNTVLYAAGEPMLKGWVWFYTGELAEIFTVTFIFIFGTLIIYFRRLYGVLLPFIGAVAQAIWGLGFLGILGYNLDPLVLVIPLLVSARAASHGVQMVERYFEELEATGDKHHAVCDRHGGAVAAGRNRRVGRRRRYPGAGCRDHSTGAQAGVLRQLLGIFQYLHDSAADSADARRSADADEDHALRAAVDA